MEIKPVGRITALPLVGTAVTDLSLWVITLPSSVGTESVLRILQALVLALATLKELESFCKYSCTH